MVTVAYGPHLKKPSEKSGIMSSKNAKRPRL